MLYIRKYNKNIDCRSLNHSIHVFEEALTYVNNAETYFHILNDNGDNYDLEYFSNDSIIKQGEEFPKSPLFLEQIMCFDYLDYDVDDAKYLYLDIFNDYSIVFFESANELTIKIIETLIKHTDKNIYVSDKRFFWFFNEDKRLKFGKDINSIDEPKVMHVVEEFVHKSMIGDYDKICSVTLFHNMFLLQYLKNLSRFKIKNIIISIPETEGIGSVLNYYFRIKKVCDMFGIKTYIKSNCTRYSDEILEKYFDINIAKTEKFKKVTFSKNIKFLNTEKYKNFKMLNLDKYKNIDIKDTVRQRMKDDSFFDNLTKKMIKNDYRGKFKNNIQHHILTKDIVTMISNENYLIKNRLGNFNKKLYRDIELNVNHIEDNEFLKNIFNKVKDEFIVNGYISSLKDKLYMDLNGYFTIDFFFAVIMTHIIYNQKPPININIFKKKFLSELKQYKDEVFMDKKVLGVLVRGTDYVVSKMMEQPLFIDDLVSKIRNIKDEGNYDCIFLATEDKDYYDELVKAFPGEIISVSQKRFSTKDFKDIVFLSEIEKENSEKNDNFNDTEDTMVNYFYSLYLLANCKGFLASPFCNGVVMAQSFNDKEFEFMEIVSNKQPNQ